MDQNIVQSDSNPHGAELTQEDDPSQILPGPPHNVIGNEEQRKNERKSARRQATIICDDLDALRLNPEVCMEDLAWSIKEARKSLDHLLALKSQAPEPEHSNHIGRLESVIFKADFRLDRLKEHDKIIMNARAQSICSKNQSDKSSCRSGSCYAKSEANQEECRSVIDKGSHDGEKVSVQQRSPLPLPIPSQQVMPGGTPRFNVGQIQIPRFGGLGWSRFWGLFSAAVDDDPFYTGREVEKLTLLQSFLDGEPFSMVEGLPLTNSSYQIACNKLKRRYDNPERQRKELIRELMNTERLSNRATLQECRKLVDNIFSTVRKLNSLNMSVQEYQRAVLPILEECIPHSWQQSWARHKLRSGELNFVDFEEFVTVELEVMEETSRESGEVKERNVKRSSPVSSVPRKSNISLPVVPDTRFCPACNGPMHRLLVCQTFLQATPQQRTQIIKNAGRCLKCLGLKHNSSKDSCRNCQCGGPHHRSLCYKSNQNRRLPVPAGSDPSNSQGASASNDSQRLSQTVQTDSENLPPVFHPSSGGHVMAVVPATSASTGDLADLAVFVKIAEVIVMAPSGAEYRVTAYLDEGSKRTYIRNDLAVAMGLPVVTTRTLSTGSFGGQMFSQPSSLVDFQVRSVHASKPGVISMQAWSTSAVCPPLCQENWPSLPDRYPSLSPWADNYNGGRRDISLLIGADHLWKVMGAVHVTPGSMTIIDTFFGYLPFGPARDLPYETQVFSSSEQDFTPSLLSIDINPSNFWSLETVGVEAPSTCNEDAFFTKPERSLEDPKRYQIRLPFSGSVRPAPNRSLVIGRQESSFFRLSSEQQEIYETKIQELFDGGIIEKASSESNVGFFLPHHLVSARKPRVVFDGSAKDCFGRSLNSCLSAGPNLCTPLLDVIIRIRRGKYMGVGDISKAFFQLETHPDDRKWLKILWKKDEYQFKRLPWGLVCSPYLLHSTIIHHVRQSIETPNAEYFIQRLYVDDLHDSEDCPDQVENFMDTATVILEDAGMNLIRDHNPHRLLGIEIDPTSDEFVFDCKFDDFSGEWTRRKLLHSVAKIFDPLGIGSPWVVKGRILLQETWMNNKVGWDESLPLNLQVACKEWWDSRKYCLRIPRCVGPLTSSGRLLLFSDASEKIYGFVAYWQTDFNLPKLLFTKARVSPLKPVLTIPRLELMGALLAARFGSKWAAEFNAPVDYWTDSSCTLTWICNGLSKKDIFVSNRIQEIRSLSDSSQWHWVPGTDNPADIPSRSASLEFLAQSQLYQHGPTFLMGSDENWPSLPFEPQLLVSDYHLNKSEEELCPLLSLLEPSRFVSWSSLCKTAAYVIRFLKPVNFRIRGPLHLQEIKDAEKRLLIEVQEYSYPDEMKSLQDGKHVSRNSSLRLLHPCLFNDVMCITPRTGEKLLPIVPPDHIVSQLMVSEHHAGLLHQGPSSTLASIRSKFWIPSGRSLVRKIIHACPPCKRFRATAYRTPEGQLPKFRTQPISPFRITGVDGFGPMYLADEQKVYGFIFTCSTTRAVHLELVQDGATANTVLAFRRFLSRRIPQFQPVEFRSDNAKVFHRLSELKFPAHPLIQWRFTPARSPSWGGWWERLIGCIKASLRIALRGKLLKFCELEAILLETEAVINKRPLTSVSSDPVDEVALTPANFLFGLSPPVDESLDPCAVTPESLRKAILIRDKMSCLVWKNWQKYYLSNLRSWTRPKGTSRLPKIGDLVLVHQHSPRGTWPLARITKLFSGSDKIPRVAEIQLRGRRTTRAVNLLYPLEGDHSSSLSFQSSSNDDQDDVQASSEFNRGGITNFNLNDGHSSKQKLAVNVTVFSKKSEVQDLVPKKTRTREIQKPARYRN